MRLTEDFKCNSEFTKNLLKALFIISVILIPFDNLPYFESVFGELSVKGPIYPFLIIIAIILFLSIKYKQVYFDNSIETTLLLIFIGWTIISIVFNITHISSHTFKGRSGIEKLLLQIMVCGFVVLIAYCTDIIINIKKLTLMDLRRYITYSLIPVGIYGLIELLHLSGVIDFTWLLENVSSLIQKYHSGVVYTKGVRTVTGEVSYFAMYCAFALPWLMSYLYTEKDYKKKALYFIGTLYLLVLITFSRSRAAYAIMFFQLFFFTGAILILKTKIQNKLLSVLSLIIILTMFVFINYSPASEVGGDKNSVNNVSIQGVVTSLSDKKNMSNVARKGMENAAVKMAKDNKVFGIGLGQYGFLANDYIEDSARESTEVQMWLGEDTQAWPPVFSFYARIMAEQGIVGLILLLILLITTGIRALKQLFTRKDDIMGISLIVSCAGVLIAWLNADSYAQISFWILLPFVIRYNNCRIKSH